MTTSHAVLIVGAGMLQVPFIREAQALGLYVIATDGNAEAQGAAFADEFYPISTYGIDQHATLVETLKARAIPPLIGVACCGNDVAPTVAAAAKAAGVPGIPVEVATKTHNKFQVRWALDDAKLRQYQPRWAAFDGTYSLAEMCAEIDVSLPGYPVVVKPASQRASRGVSIVQSQDGLAQAVAAAQVYGDEGLIEQCLVGTEHSAEAIFGEDGAVLWFNTVDRLFDYSSGTGIELGHVNPTCLTPQQKQQTLFMLCAAARALGVKWGPFKVDCMWTVDGPKILEVTARLSGGFDCQGTSPLTGRFPMQTLLQLACGLPIEKPPRMDADGFAACAAILPRQEGMVRSLPSIPTTAPHPKSYAIIWAIAEGMPIHPATHNGERAGFVLASGATYLWAWKTAKQVADWLSSKIVVEAVERSATPPP